MHRTRNAAYPHGYREFESPPIRHFFSEAVYCLESLVSLDSCPANLSSDLSSMATNPSLPRQSFGHGLYKVGNQFYVRVSIPRDLKAAYKAAGKPSSEIFEPLGTTERREAERRCRKRRAEIDAEFELQRKATAKVTDSGQDSLDIDAMARRVFEHKRARFLHKWLPEIRTNPDQAELLLSYQLDDWVMGLEEDAWSKDVNDTIIGILQSQGLLLTEDHPKFEEYRNKIARAMAGSFLVTRKLAEGVPDYRPRDPLLIGEAEKVKRGAVTLGDLIKRYEADKGATWSGKTRDGYVLIYRALTELLGENKPVREIDREDCREIRQILLDLAPNYTKLPATRGKPMREAAQISRTLDLPRRKPDSVNSYMNNLAALLNYAEKEGIIDKSPAKGLMVAGGNKKDKKYSFTIQQLVTIFNAPLYTTKQERGGKFWVPLVSLWTGMRLNECCQLLTDDIREMDGVHIIIVSEDSKDGVDDKRVKTEAGERYVPIHPELVRIGLLIHWESMKKKRERRLFPDLNKGVNGYYSNPFSQSFGRFLKEINIKTSKISFHSFRHTYRDALRHADISVERVKALGGWANTETHEDYGSGFKPSVLFEEIKKVRYDGLDLSHLYVTNKEDVLNPS